MTFFRHLGWATLISILATGAACAEPDSCVSSADRSPVAATAGDHPITESQIDCELWRGEAGPRLESLKAQIYMLKRDELVKMLLESIVEQGASKAGLSMNDFLKRNIDDLVREPSEEQMHALYDSFHGRLRESYEKDKPLLAANIKGREKLRLHDLLMNNLAAWERPTMLLDERFRIDTGDNPALGPEKAPVTIVEFADFEDSATAAAQPALKQVRAKYGDKVRLVFMDVPQAGRMHAPDAGVAAYCAGQQGRFWDYYDALFADQSRLAVDDLRSTAARLGLDKDSFEACLHSNQSAQQLAQAFAQAEMLAINDAPVFYVNGRPLFGPQPPQVFDAMVDQELARRQR